MRIFLSQSSAMEENHPTLYSEASEMIDLGTAPDGENYVPIIYNAICDPAGNDIKIYLHHETGLWVAPSGIHYSDVTVVP